MANNFDGIITNPPRTGMSFTPVIDVSNWKENLSEMHGLKGNEGVLNIPHSIGKSEMQEIANNLGKARKAFKELEHAHDEYHQKKHAIKMSAFKDWQYKLNRNDTLPRGKFFAGKVAGKPIVIMDELSTYFSPAMESNLTKLR